MKKRVINFGDNRLFGAVGEWGLVLTDLTGAAEDGLPPVIQLRNRMCMIVSGLMISVFHFIAFSLGCIEMDKEMLESMLRFSGNCASLRSIFVAE